MNKFKLILFISVVIFLIPFSFSKATLDPGLLPKYLILILFLLMYALINVRGVILSRTTSHQTFHLGMLHYCLAGLLLFSFFSLYKAIAVSESFFEIIKTICFVLFIVFTTALLNLSGTNRTFILRAITLTALLASLLGLIEYWGIFQILGYSKGPAVTMGNRNLYSSFLFLCMGFILNGLWHSGKGWFSVSLLAFSTISYSLIITSSRAVWVACISGLLLTIVVILLIDHRRAFNSIRHKWQRVVLIGSILVCLVLIHNNFHPVEKTSLNIQERLISVVDTRFESNSERIKLWKKTVKMVQENLFLGVGSGNWKIHLPKYSLDDLVWNDMTRIFIRPHNDFLGVLSEIGIFGFISFLGIFFITAYYAIRVIRKKSDRNESPLATCLLFTVFGYFVISFFDFPWERIEHLVLWGIIVSFSISLNRPLLKEVKFSYKGSFCIHLGYTVTLVICLIFGIIRLKSDLAMMEVLTSKQEGNWKQVVKQVGKINKYFYSVDPTSTPVYWYRGVANFSLNRVDLAMNDFKRANAVHPYHIHVLNNLGSCYMLLDSIQQAEEQYKKALAISPLFNESIINLSILYFNTGKYNQAWKAIEPIKDYDTPRVRKLVKALKGKLHIDASVH